jgi:2-polyprenyl-6-methoxyphenol hydroxylase-like FAD-dependent oxidoreductase
MTVQYTQVDAADQHQPPDEAPVLIVGAGPAGLIAALQLSKNGQRCVLIERNLDTTKWPKMDITNCRSMELLKRLGVDRGLRKVGEWLSQAVSRKRCQG